MTPPDGPKRCGFLYWDWDTGMRCIPCEVEEEDHKYITTEPHPFTPAPTGAVGSGSLSSAGESSGQSNRPVAPGTGNEETEGQGVRSVPPSNPAEDPPAARCPACDHVYETTETRQLTHDITSDGKLWCAFCEGECALLRQREAERDELLSHRDQIDRLYAESIEKRIELEHQLQAARVLLGMKARSEAMGGGKP